MVGISILYKHTYIKFVFRLHSLLLLPPNTVLDVIDLTGIKKDNVVSAIRNTKCEQSTQTENEPTSAETVTETFEVKKEPVGSPDTLPGEEIKHESDNFEDHNSNSSDDMCLLVLKNKKKIKNDKDAAIVNNYNHKKKAKHKDFSDILTSVPEGMLYDYFVVK